nr:diglucosylglycerate octanoyltransferase [Nocardia terpenica]
MSSEKSASDRDEPVRQVSDELLRKASEGPVRHLPDALFGGPAPGSAAPQRDSGADERAGAVSDELLRQASQGPVRHLPDLLFGGPAPEPSVREQDSASESDGGDDSGDTEGATGPPAASRDGALDPDDIRQSEPAGSSVQAPTAHVGDAAQGETAVGSGSAGRRGDESAEPAGDSGARPVLLVIADSLSYFGPKGGLPADDPRIWPNLVGAELDWDVELIGRIGWTCRDAYWALIGDPRVWAAVPRAGAVVFATGGMDSLPSPLPTALRELIRYVRPPAVRRRVRAGYQWLQPRLSRLGRPVALPPKVSVDYLEQSRHALAQLRPDLPVVGVLPSVHNCDAYGRVHTGREPAVRALREWSAKTGVPLVDLGDAVRDNIFSGEANPDGIHWGWEGHAAVARAMVKGLSEVRSGEAGAAEVA